MAGLDAAIAGAVAWIEQNLLVDTVRITLPATGTPVLDDETGQLEYPDGSVLYEGPGAVLPASSPPMAVVSTANQPWVGETRSTYRLLTPLDAPVAPKDALVTVTAVHDPARAQLIGRTWQASDPGRVGTVEAVRVTPLDQQQGGAT
jgi:hypothetical protein